MKAILVSDMPTCCRECQFCTEIQGSEFFEEHYSCAARLWGQEDFISARDVNEKREWCPLKPLPKKKPIYNAIGMTQEVINLPNMGYNKCIEEIEE